MAKYLIHNEDGDLMRIVGRQEEARCIVALRLGWSFKCVRYTRTVDLSQFEDALI